MNNLDCGKASDTRKFAEDTKIRQLLDKRMMRWITKKIKWPI